MSILDEIKWRQDERFPGRIELGGQISKGFFVVVDRRHQHLMPEARRQVQHQLGKMIFQELPDIIEELVQMIHRNGRLEHSQDAIALREQARKIMNPTP